jgi:hypothetical protein
MHCRSAASVLRGLLPQAADRARPRGPGCITPELLDGTDHVAWFDAGATIFSNKGIQYLGVPGLINAKSIIATLLVQVILMGAIEGYRVNGGPAGEGLDKACP